jgi:rubredoxin
MNAKDNKKVWQVCAVCGSEKGERHWNRVTEQWECRECFYEKNKENENK